MHGLYGWQQLSIGVALLTAGCSSAPSGIAPADLDPAGSTDRALAAYDANGDQKLTQDELKACPGLLSAIGRFDQDGDGAISADELTSNLQEFQNQGAGLVAISCVVRRNNQPVEGATVSFVPESFLGDSIKPATGVTSSEGTTSPCIADEELPAEYRGRVRGVQCGVYRVVVTHPTIAIPARINAQTEIGRIVARRDHDPLTIDF